MRGQVKIQQKKLAARRRRRIRLITLYSLAAAGLVLCGLSYLSRLPSLSIQSVAVEGNSRLSSEAVEATVFKDIVGSYYGLFSKRNVLLYPKGDVERDVRALPLVLDADISRRDVTTVVVSMKERTETSRYCSGPIGVADECYSVDDNGFVFAKDPSARCAAGESCLVATSTRFFTYRSATSSISNVASGSVVGATSGPVGANVASPQEFKKLAFFIHELSGLSVEPREAVMMSNSTSTAGYVTIVLAQGGKLLVNADDDLSAVLGNLAAVVSDKAVVPSLSDFLAKLDYMKLDAGNKIVYKMRK